MRGEKRTFDDLVDEVQDDSDVTTVLVHDIILRIQTVGFRWARFDLSEWTTLIFLQVVIKTHSFRKTRAISIC